MFESFLFGGIANPHNTTCSGPLGFFLGAARPPHPCGTLTMRYMGRSKVASEITRERMARIAAMSLDERFALLERMREEGLTTYSELHGVDRPTAIARIKATHRFGRRRSVSASADEY